MSGIFLNVLLILTHLITATTLVRYYYPPFCEKTEAKRGVYLPKLLRSSETRIQPKRVLNLHNKKCNSILTLRKVKERKKIEKERGRDEFCFNP